MTVRVVDNQALLGEIEGAIPFRVQLLGTTSGMVLPFPYNPESWSERYNPQWVDRGLPGRARPIFDWSRNDAGELTVDYVLQLDDPQAAQSFIVNLKTASIIPNQISGEPEIWEFLAGTFEFLGHVSSLTVNHVRTKASGDPDIAEIQFTMTENDRGFA